MRRLRWVVSAVVLVAVGCKSKINDTYGALPAVGSQVPAFRYATLDGSILTPDSLRGQPTVIALWATTCPASRLALTSLAALEIAYVPHGTHVVILADDRDSAAVASLVAGEHVRARVGLGAGTLMNTFTHGQSVLPWRKVFALPTFLVLDASGRIVYRQIGIEQNPGEQLGRVRANLDSLLRRPLLDSRGTPGA